MTDSITSETRPTCPACLSRFDPARKGQKFCKKACAKNAARRAKRGTDRQPYAHQPKPHRVAVVVAPLDTVAAVTKAREVIDVEAMLAKAAAEMPEVAFKQAPYGAGYMGKARKLLRLPVRREVTP